MDKEMENNKVDVDLNQRGTLTVIPQLKIYLIP